MKRVIYPVLILIIFLTCPFIIACSNNELESESNKTVIAVTIVPEKTFVQAVCGDLVEVITVVPPGNSPENYEPTPIEMQRLSKASLYFCIGVPTEKTNILPEIKNVRTISLQDEVALVYPDRLFESGARDPHIWLSPRRVKVIIEAIATEMIKLDETNKDTYLKNVESYSKQLDELDQQVSTVLEGLESKKFIVYHPAFGYLADDYGLQMYALEKEGKEATIKNLLAMIDLAKKENIKAIFYQDEIDSSQAKAFAEEIGGGTLQLEPLAADYIENLKRMMDIMAGVMQ